MAAAGSRDTRTEDHSRYEAPEAPEAAERAVEKAPEAPAVAARPAAVEPRAAEPVPSSGGDDTITEAEVYMRYGLHGQAEDLLKSAIERSPDNEEYQFKLLENYHDQKNAEGFNEAVQVYGNKFPNSANNNRVAEMGRDLNGDADQSVDGKSADDSNDSNKPSSSGPGGMMAGAGITAAGAAAVVAGVTTRGKDAAASGLDSAKDSIGNLGGDAGIDSSGDRSDFDMSDLDTSGMSDSGDARFDAGQMNLSDHSDSLLDQTIDPGSEFSVDELQATGDLNALMKDAPELDDPTNLELDDIDLASLDDDGTMNLEEVVGDQMSGTDLGTLDLTGSDTDNFDDLSLEDTDPGSGNVGGIAGIAGGISSGLDSDTSADDMVPGGADEMESMLDLAKAYIDMGDTANAKKSLEEIISRGNPLQRAEANALLNGLL